MTTALSAVRPKSTPERQRSLPLLLAVLIAALSAFFVIFELPYLCSEKAPAEVTNDGTDAPFVSEDGFYIEPSGEIFVAYTVGAREYSAQLLDPPAGLHDGDRLMVVCDLEHPESVRPFRLGLPVAVISALVLLVTAYVTLWRLHDMGIIE